MFKILSSVFVLFFLSITSSAFSQVPNMTFFYSGQDEWRFVITEQIKEVKPFKVNDSIVISEKKSSKHYRNGKLLKNYPLEEKSVEYPGFGMIKMYFMKSEKRAFFIEKLNNFITWSFTKVLSANEKLPTKVNAKSFDVYYDGTFRPIVKRVEGVPDCINNLLYKGDAEYVRKGKTKSGKTYFLVRHLNPMKCFHCHPSLAYYDESCTEMAREGMGRVEKFYRVNDPYTAADFGFPSNAEVIRKDSNDVTFSFEELKTEQRFVIETVSSKLNIFKKGDVLLASRKDGLKHFRNNQLLNQYKIVPKMMRVKYDYTTIFSLAFFLDPLKSAFVIQKKDGKINWLFSPAENLAKSPGEFQEKDWYVGATLKK